VVGGVVTWQPVTGRRTAPDPEGGGWGVFDKWMTRGVLVVALGAGAAGVVAAGSPTVASADTSSMLCSKFFGHITSKVVIAKCNVTRHTANIAGSDFLTGGTLTWGKSGATTAYAGSADSPGQGSCAVGRVEYDFTGTVTADTSTYVSEGDTVTYDLCVNSRTNVVKLVKGTKASF
jgi:hypothetical protein